MRSVKRQLFVLVALVETMACGKSDSTSSAKRIPGAGPAATPLPVSGSAGCPTTGKWAPCSVLYAIVRAGYAVHVDSAAKPDETRLSGQSFVARVGQFAMLDVFVYPDSTARKNDGAKLDTTEFVNGTAPQTMRRERTLIVNNNLIALLTSLDAHQRERVSDALTAGAPQPPTP